MTLYLIRAACPHCEEVTNFVEETSAPVGLMQDVRLSAELCPHCGVHLWTEGYEWDVQEESEIERVEPTDPLDDETGIVRFGIDSWDEVKFVLTGTNDNVHGDGITLEARNLQPGENAVLEVIVGDETKARFIQ